MGGRPLSSAALPVVVVGGGIAGIACARHLHDAGVEVRVYERGHRAGGRMAVRTEYLPPVGVWSVGHPVDIGAPYFTVREPAFAAVVAGWEAAGLVRPWTDRFTVADLAPPVGSGSTGSGMTGSGGLSEPGPTRWVALLGMRALVESLADGLTLEAERQVVSVREVGGRLTVDGAPAAAAVLAMPDRQAVRHLDPDVAEALDVSGRPSSPVLAVWAAWPERWWPGFDGIFVNGSDILTWVADSGRAHGDDVPVLVAHSTNDFAAPRLKDPQSGLEPMTGELARVLGSLGAGPLPAPEWVRLHRWSFAAPVGTHEESFGLLDQPLIGVCGDAWGPKSRVEQAWLSGHALAEALVSRLASAAR